MDDHATVSDVDRLNLAGWSGSGSTRSGRWPARFDGHPDLVVESFPLPPRSPRSPCLDPSPASSRFRAARALPSQEQAARPRPRRKRRPLSRAGSDQMRSGSSLIGVSAGRGCFFRVGPVVHPRSPAPHRAKTASPNGTIASGWKKSAALRISSRHRAALAPKSHKIGDSLSQLCRWLQERKSAELQPPASRQPLAAEPLVTHCTNSKPTGSV